MNAIRSRINKMSEVRNIRSVPDLLRQVTKEEDMRVVFNGSTNSAMFINLSGISPYSLSSG